MGSGSVVVVVAMAAEGFLLLNCTHSLYIL